MVSKEAFWRILQTAVNDYMEVKYKKIMWRKKELYETEDTVFKEYDIKYGCKGEFFRKKGIFVILEIYFVRNV